MSDPSPFVGGYELTNIAGAAFNVSSSISILRPASFSNYALISSEQPQSVYVRRAGGSGLPIHFSRARQVEFRDLFLRFVSNFENNFTSSVARFDLLLRFRGFG